MNLKKFLMKKFGKNVFSLSQEDMLKERVKTEKNVERLSDDIKTIQESIPSGLGDSTVNIGRRNNPPPPSGSHYFSGMLDELRFSTTARTASWCIASYRNQSAPMSFYTLDPEEAR